VSKALMAGLHGQVLQTGEEFNFGGLFQNSSEAHNQYSATEAATFTGLRGLIVTGNDVSATFRFRNNGANGNNIATIAGTGAFEDTTNSDTVPAADLFTVAYTDTGTDSTVGPIAINVEFASGHGNFHGSSSNAGVILDVQSATRYLAMNGTLGADGTATIANVQMKIREYTSLEAIQAMTSANARLNDSVISVNVNGVDVGTPITFGAGVSGRQIVTGMGIALSPGDLVCYSVTLGAGIEDLTLLTMCATFKSTANASGIGYGNHAGTARAASATPNYYSVGNGVATTESNAAVKVGFAARCGNLRCYLSVNTYTVDATLKLFVNGTGVITLTLTAAGGAGWYENTTDFFNIDDNDVISFEIVGGTSGSIDIHQIWISFFSAAAAPRAMHQYRQRRVA
jgi:hypothetical protein